MGPNTCLLDHVVRVQSTLKLGTHPQLNHAYKGRSILLNEVAQCLDGISVGSTQGLFHCWFHTQILSFPSAL